MKKTAFILIIVSSLLFWSCAEKSPLKIDKFDLNEVTSQASFNRSNLMDGDDYSVGYYNGNIQTTKVNLEWGKSNSDNFLCYKLLRDGELYTFSDVNFTAFSDTLLAQDQTYDYKIFTVTTEGNIASDTLTIKTPKWETPSELQITGLNFNTVEVFWADNCESETEYRVYLEKYDSFAFQFVMVDSIINSQNDDKAIFTDLEDSSTYRFSVKGDNQWEEYTNLAVSNNFYTPFNFDPPSNLSVNHISESNAIKLNWDDNSTMETGFEIERKIGTGSEFELLISVEANFIEYTDNDTTSFEIGDNAVYRIRGFNDYEETVYTEYSNIDSLIIIDYFFEELNVVMDGLSANYENITNIIPNRYDFSGGFSGYYIYDGGNDMYNNGNKLNTNIDADIHYSNYIISNSDSFGEDGKYFTTKFPGLFVMAADINEIEFFEISGGLGADGNGDVDGVILETEFEEHQYQGFVKRVHNSLQPSVNHLVIIPKNEEVIQSYSSDTDYDDHTINNLENTKRIYYLLFAGTEGYYIDDDAILAIMNAFLASI
ncbi:MAG: hypothetical protein K8S23_17125 [Candidatus Cloacimonetes bacterium]|nr:hypothetical protein [Candidatus Cloacimonadota bacterium]